MTYTDTVLKLSNDTVCHQQTASYKVLVKVIQQNGNSKEEDLRFDH
jgi:hypothetical protein